MQNRFNVILLLAIVLAIIPTLAFAADWSSSGKHAPPVLAALASLPGTINLNLTADPVTIDPALDSETNSTTIVEQLFSGLVKLDDTTSAVLPDLATSWTLSADHTVYTFNLRSDAFWSDGNPVTAQDVRYGILRTLSPAVNPGGANMAYTLYIIKNAQGYNTGSIVDPNQVGVVALDSTHLQITLNYAASYALSIFSTPGARPVPQWTITTWGSTWTDPAHIVTNGAYRLTEWAHGDHIFLDKNLTYYGATQVQIQRFNVWIVANPTTAWTMFLNGQLDTVSIPTGAALDPLLKQQINVQPSACTYYYGMNVNKPPFNNVLVRKAFSAAVDKQGLINAKLGGVQRPALTFTPPGVFGYVDGQTQGVGIRYDVTQARQWLAQAGYPNGQGLPPVTLWFNTSVGHQAIAQYIQQNWYTNLGVNVTLQNEAWSTYQTDVHNGQFQIWRLGWCMDYPDANNFLNDGIVSNGSAFGNWSKTTYNSLVGQAAWQQDPTIRQSLYKQAEQILVETEAVMLPLYFYASSTATRPYLQRTYSVSYPNFSTWRDLRVSATIGTGGGTLSSYYGDTTIQVPPGAFTDTIVISYTPSVGMLPTGNTLGIGHVFEVSATYSSTGAPAQPAPGQTVTIQVHYLDSETGVVGEKTLALYNWNGSQWVKDPSSTVDITINTVTATPTHLSLWAVLGETQQLFLPLVER